MKSICIFAGSSSGSDPEFAELARRVGSMVAARGLGVVFGGGRSGLMGAVADGAIAEGGHVRGVMPRFMETLEVSHPGVAELTVTETLQQRKDVMYDESDAFIALPGGYGTMDEMLGAITRRQLKLHDKPLLFFNHKAYWDGFVSAFLTAGDQGFIRPPHLALFEVVDDLDELGDLMDGFADKT